MFKTFVAGGASPSPTEIGDRPYGKFKAFVAGRRGAVPYQRCEMRLRRP
ncbi:MAG: hypothetical protein IKV16_04785 [Clostridia bacterium]|nr:hypothetical protein [Clostridia bacterium]